MDLEHHDNVLYSNIAGFATGFAAALKEVRRESLEASATEDMTNSRAGNNYSVKWHQK